MRFDYPSGGGGNRTTRGRAGISPFLATVMLVVITLMIGGILYTQFRQMIVSQVKNPSIGLMDSNVARDGETMTLNLKNDGNVPLTVTSVSVSYGAATNSFPIGGNATMIASSSGSASLQPGDTLTTKVKTTFPVPTFGTFTITVVSDQVAKAFNIQA